MLLVFERVNRLSNMEYYIITDRPKNDDLKETIICLEAGVSSVQSKKLTKLILGNLFS